MKIYSTIIALVITLFIACTPTKQTTPASDQATGTDKKAAPDAALQETYWKLTEVMGKPVTTPADAREAHIKLRKEDNRLEGFAGCNSMMGKYTLGGREKISFTAGSTRMMCERRMETENSLMSALSMADSYLIKGDTLQLFKARMAQLAKFQAVYF